MKEIKTTCDKDNLQMFPYPLPESNNELIRLLKNVYKYNKPFILTKKRFCKLIRGGYIRFKCKKCGFEKLIKIEEILVNGYIDGNVCKKCELETCEWVNCTKGGYMKE